MDSVDSAAIFETLIEKNEALHQIAQLSAEDCLTQQALLATAHAQLEHFRLITNDPRRARLRTQLIIDLIFANRSLNRERKGSLARNSTSKIARSKSSPAKLIITKKDILRASPKPNDSFSLSNLGVNCLQLIEERDAITAALRRQLTNCRDEISRLIVEKETLRLELLSYAPLKKCQNTKWLQMLYSDINLEQPFSEDTLARFSFNINRI